MSVSQLTLLCLCEITDLSGIVCQGPNSSMRTHTARSFVQCIHVMRCMPGLHFSSRWNLCGTTRHRYLVRVIPLSSSHSYARTRLEYLPYYWFGCADQQQTLIEERGYVKQYRGKDPCAQIASSACVTHTVILCLETVSWDSAVSGR